MNLLKSSFLALFFLTHFLGMLEAVPPVDQRPFLWSCQNSVLPQAQSLIQLIETVDQEGLDPQFYSLNRIQYALKAGEWQLLDQLLTDAFFLLAHDFAYGHLSHHLTEDSWVQKQGAFDKNSFMIQAVKENQVSQALKALLPVHSDYVDLKRSLNYYQSLSKKGGWGAISGLYLLTDKSRSAGIAQVKSRLVVTGELSADKINDPELFDEDLKKAIRVFQQENGLEADGIIGPKTWETLNQPVTDKIALVRINLDRWRWLPHELGARYIVVNIAAGSLRVVEDGKTRLMMKVIVGRKTRKTLLFQSNITGVTINPYWNVPGSIARKDIIKEIRKDSRYLEKKHIQVFSRNYGEGRLNPYAINWFSSNLHVYFQQLPGELNALGKVKFNMDNPYDIYLHDTAHRELFGQFDYALSSGCIRLEKPLELLQLLLEKEPEDSQTKASAALKDEVQHVLKFKNPTKVYLMYLTVLPLPQGQQNVFYQDIYDKDKVLLESLSVMQDK